MCDDLLLPLAREVLSSEYKKFYSIRRGNMLANIQSYPQLWECFQLLDQIWLREIEDLGHQTERANKIPLMLFVNGHAQFRVALELGFVGSIGSAWNALRSAIDSIVHALKMVREPNSIKVWLEMNDGDVQRKEFEKVFVRRRKESLFPPGHGLEELHECWARYSEWGTHSTLAALAITAKIQHTTKQRESMVHYFETDEKILAQYLFSLLVASHLMEEQFFKAFRNLLDLDNALSKMRQTFVTRKETERVRIIHVYRIKPPSVWRK